MKKFKFLDAAYYAIASRPTSQADAKRKAKTLGLVQAHAARAYAVLQKIRALNSVALAFNSFISRSMYATITGACNTGITQFCEKHNITKRRIKVSELLEIMDGTEYGYQKFIGVITND